MQGADCPIPYLENIIRQLMQKIECLDQCSKMYGKRSLFINIFLLGFSHIKYEYIIENWVWLRWLGLELGLQNAAGPFISSLELVLLCQPSPIPGQP